MQSALVIAVECSGAACRWDAEDSHSLSTNAEGRLLYMTAGALSPGEGRLGSTGVTPYHVRPASQPALASSQLMLLGLKLEPSRPGSAAQTT